MKIFLLLVVIGGAAYFLTQTLRNKKESASVTTSFKDQNLKPDLCACIAGDVSGSRLKNGVDLLHSSQLQPYFDETNRNIDLYYSLICNTSIVKPFHLFLQKKGFLKPDLVVIQGADRSDMHDARKLYKDALVKYENDSIAFYKRRNAEIYFFVKSVDSVFKKYSKDTTDYTDIKTCLLTFKKIQTQFKSGSVETFTLLFSDGLDNRNKGQNYPKGNGTLILVNTGPDLKTPIDSLIDLKLATIEESISYTLKH